MRLVLTPCGPQSGLHADHNQDYERPASGLHADRNQDSVRIIIGIYDDSSGVFGS